jgi:hypothetical protein
VLGLRALRSAHDDGLGRGGFGSSEVGSGEGVAIARANDAVGHGVVGGFAGLDQGDGAEVIAGELQGVEQGAGAFGTEAAGDHVGKEEGDGDLDGFCVFKGLEGEMIRGGEGLGDLGKRFTSVEEGFDLGGSHIAEGGGWRETLGVSVVEGAVEVAVCGAVDGGRLTALAVGLDVSANRVVSGVGSGGHWVPFVG